MEVLGILLSPLSIVYLYIKVFNEQLVIETLQQFEPIVVWRCASRWNVYLMRITNFGLGPPKELLMVVSQY